MLVYCSKEKDTCNTSKTDKYDVTYTVVDHSSHFLKFILAKFILVHLKLFGLMYILREEYSYFLQDEIH